MKQIYKNATIGPSINIQLECVLSDLPIELEIKELTKGWNVVHDEKHHKVSGNCSRSDTYVWY